MQIFRIHIVVDINGKQRLQGGFNFECIQMYKTNLCIHSGEIYQIIVAKKLKNCAVQED